MNNSFKIVFFLAILVNSVAVKGQDTDLSKEHNITFKTQFLQIKDEINYGLVFRGLNLNVGYSYMATSDNHMFSYSADLAFGANYNKGVGFAWHFQPVDLYYGFKIDTRNTVSLTLGPYLAANYQWQLYPELQSGHMLWFTTIETGPRLILTMPYKSRLFRVTFTNSFAGLTSRPEPATETYFYSLQFSDFLRNAHSNMKFGTFNLFNHTNFIIEILNSKAKRLSVGYEFEYLGIYKAPKLSYFVHSFNLKWKLGNL